MQDPGKLLRPSGTDAVPGSSQCCGLDSQTVFFLHKIAKFLKGGELGSLNMHGPSDSLGLRL